MVSPESGTQVLIKQDAATFTSGPPSRQGSPTVVYKLDGTESRNVMVNDGVESIGVGKASWNWWPTEDREHDYLGRGRAVGSATPLVYE